jgi:hypothetical protein
MENQHSRHGKRIRRGATLIEVLTAAGMSTMVMFGVILALLSGMKSWAQGESKIVAEQGSQQAVRQISVELREAMSVTVDAGGNSLSYRLPQKDGNGNYVVPAQWDGVNRRIFYQNSDNGNTIKLGPYGHEREICKNVVLQEPLTGGGSSVYRIFSPGAGSITRQLTVMVVTQTSGVSNNKLNSRIRETIYLRNIPTLTQ